MSVPSPVPLGSQPLTPTGHPCTDIFGDRFTLLVPAEHTGGNFSLFECLFHPGTPTSPGHSHPFTETFQVFEGLLEFTLMHEGTRQTFTAGPGALVHIAPRVPHVVRNIGRIPARTHTVVSPGSAENFFFEAGVAVPPRCPGVTPTSLSKAPDPAALAPILERYGVCPADL